MLKFGPPKMIASWAFEKEHILKMQVKIDYPEHILHGRVIYKEILTKKINDFEFSDKPEVVYYINYDEKSFTRFKDLLKHYNLGKSDFEF